MYKFEPFPKSEIECGGVKVDIGGEISLKVWNIVTGQILLAEYSKTK
jgi:hypothetical protein